MRERYRVLRIPRRTKALREALLQAAASVAACPACAASLRRVGRLDAARLLRAIALPAAALTVRTALCPECRREDRGIPALAFSCGTQTRLLVSVREGRIEYTDPITVSDLFCAAEHEANIFLPLLRLLGRLGGRRWVPMAVVIWNGRALVRDRDFTPLVRVGDRIAVEGHANYPFVIVARLASPLVAFDEGWELEHPIYIPVAGRRLVEDLLACSSEEEARRVLTMWGLANEL